MLTTALTIGPLWLSTDQERRKRIYLNCQMDHVSEVVKTYVTSFCYVIKGTSGVNLMQIQFGIKHSFL